MTVEAWWVAGQVAGGGGVPNQTAVEEAVRKAMMEYMGNFGPIVATGDFEQPLIKICE